MKKKLPVAELQFGVYVYELDRPWSETPFVFQGFVLKTEQQLDGLKKYCKHVFVYTEGARTEKAPVLQPGSGPVAADLQGTGKVIHAARVSVESEFARATDTRSAAISAVTDAFGAIRADKALDSGEIKLAADNMTESMLRNPDAMVLLSALQDRGGYQLDRAMARQVQLDPYTRAHLADSKERISQALNAQMIQTAATAR